MPAVVRLNDLSKGHNGFPPTPSLGGSPNVFANGLSVHRVNDPWQAHSNGSVVHTGIQVNGSPNVFANGKAIARVGDAISCGDTAANGSPNVFVN